jgi:hypothetical protein
VVRLLDALCCTGRARTGSTDRPQAHLEGIYSVVEAVWSCGARRDLIIKSVDQRVLAKLT